MSTAVIVIAVLLGIALLGYLAALLIPVRSRLDPIRRDEFFGSPQGIGETLLGGI